MSKKFYEINCCLCNERIGINFNEDIKSETYCDFCAESIMSFTNKFKPNTYIFNSFWNIGHGKAHKMGIASAFYTYELFKNTLDEIIYKQKEDIKNE